MGRTNAADVPIAVKKTKEDSVVSTGIMYASDRRTKEKVSFLSSKGYT